MKTEDHLRLLTAAIVGDDKAREAALAALAEHHEAATTAATAKAREAKLVAYTAEEFGDPISRMREARAKAEERLAREEASEAAATK